MRRALALFLLAGGAVYVVRRARGGARERVSFYYADGSMVTLDRKTPGVDRMLALGRDAL